MQSDEESWGELIVIDPPGLFACISSLWFKWCFQNCYLYFNRILSQWNLYEFFFLSGGNDLKYYFILWTQPLHLWYLYSFQYGRVILGHLTVFLSDLKSVITPREHGSSSGGFRKIPYLYDSFVHGAFQKIGCKSDYSNGNGIPPRSNIKIMLDSWARIRGLKTRQP